MSEMFWDGGEGRRAELERHKENSARLAFVNAKFESTGQGNIQFEDQVTFGLTFIEEPYADFGFELNLEDLEDQLGLDVSRKEVPPLPIVTGYITDWDQDERGFWVGAWYAARVWYPPTDLIPVTARPVIQHHLTFSGVAMKDVPIDNDKDTS